MNKAMVGILRVLDSELGITSSREVAKKIRLYGVELAERTVRYHMKILDELGYTEVFGKEGRKITARGKSELTHTLVSEQVGFVISKIETLSYLTTLNLNTMKGSIILNVTYIPEERAGDAMAILQEVITSPYVISNRMILAHAGERIGDVPVPEGKVGLGTICSITINGIFLKAGIPITSRFGGILEAEAKRFPRFVALISYEGSSLDPLEIFIRGKMTRVLEAVRNQSGKILASLREIPVVCRDEALRLSQKMASQGLGGVLLIGNPNTPMLDIPVGINKAGMIVLGGLNPIAALEEAGIPTESRAMSALVAYEQLKPLDCRGRHYEKSRGNYKTV